MTEGRRGCDGMPVVTCGTATGDLVTLHLPPGLQHRDMAAVVDTLLQVGGAAHCSVCRLQCVSRLGTTAAGWGCPADTTDCSTD